MAGVSTGGDFEDLADDLEKLEDDVPEIINEAIEETAKDLREEVCNQVELKGKAQGGPATFDSRTSGYDPGGENDSSDDGLHISEPSAWMAEVQKSSQVGFVAPKPEVRDRAEYLNSGTADGIEPDGETPMYFQVYGYTIVVSSIPEEQRGEDIPLAERFNGEPRSVDGVDETNYFTHAIKKIRDGNVFEDNLKEAFEIKVKQTKMFSV